MQLLGSSERTLLVVVIDAMMTGSSYSRKFLGFFFWLGIGELCILELIKSWTTKYHCKYLNSIGISKTSLFMTWSKSFKDLLFKDAIESCIKSEHYEGRLSVIFLDSLLISWSRIPRIRERDLPNGENIIPIKLSFVVVYLSHNFSIKPYGHGSRSFFTHLYIFFSLFG